MQETFEYRGIEYSVWVADYNESPRVWEEETKLCIRKHRNYTFANELDFDFEIWPDDYNDWDLEYYQEQYKENQSKLDWYHIFWIDMYEHSAIKFSLWGEGMQCRFDTSSGVWFIAIPKTILWHWIENCSKEEAQKIAKYQNVNQHL